jgi:peptidyl-tRNA hydrolase, PTH2 family
MTTDEKVLEEKNSSKFKQVIIVRTDLDMGKGKIAAQVAHASLYAAISAMVDKRHKDKRWFEKWFNSGDMFKIVLKCRDMFELLELLDKTEKAALPYAIQNDRGYTQVQRNTTTCLAIGPGPAEEIDKITGGLKLL